MTAQHTPGPFHVEAGTFVCAPDGSALCWTEQRADADLFAIAPDLMLIALRVAEWMRAVDADADCEYLNGDGWRDMGETAEMARSAIAKVRGEA